jgi:hypothetical protein
MPGVTTACRRSTATLCRLACVLALGALLAGCDKCGDWWWSPARGDSQSCRDQAPRPQ